MGVIDAHAHLHLRPGATDKLVRLMDKLGIEKTVVVAGGTISPEALSEHYCRGGSLDVDVDNAAILEQCLQTESRLLPFFYANPFRGTEPYKTQGKSFYGLKLAPIVHGVPLLDERITNLIEVAETFNHSVYLHCLPHEGFGVADLITLAKRHPRVRLILGHGGVGHGDFAAITLIKPIENIYFEISGTFTMAARIACERLGAERVLFGSEYPLQDHTVELQKMECLGLNDADKERVMGGNMLALLNLN